MELKEPATCVDDALEYCHGSAAGWDNAVDYVYGDNSPGAASRADPGIVLRGSLALPSAFVSLYDSVRYKSFMGLFPQINRAWLTVDTRLFLWAYSADSFVGLDPALAAQPLPQGTSRYDDFFTYEGFDQVIVAVDLVHPRPGVFVEGLQYLLAVATSVEVTLLGVTFSGPESTGEIRLIPTNISVATDNVLMVKISSTPDGRIFMAGADGSLHEFVYEGEPQRWMLGLLPTRPRKKARKVVYNSSSLVKYFLPAPLSSYFSREDELLDLVIDSARNALFTLSQQGSLTVYDISDKNAVKSVKSISVAHESRNYVSLSIPAAEREYVSIFAIPPHLSDQVHLIVVTSFGERIYFSTSAGTRGERRPKTLAVCGYRPSPITSSSNAGRPCIHMAWWNKGSLVMADLRDKESDQLITLFPDASMAVRNAPPRNTIAKPVEMVFELSASPEPHANYQLSAQGSDSDHARTFAIGQVHELVQESSPMEKSPINSPRFFWVLTSQRLHLYERVQPINRLTDILSANGGSDSDIRAFFSRYGAGDVCAMCITLAISQPALAAAAARVFYAFGGDPSTLVDPQANGASHGNVQSPMDTEMARDSFAPRSNFGDRERPPSGRYFDVGRPAMQSAPTTKFSGAHEGTSLYIAQVIYPLWYECVTSSRDPNGYQSLAFPKEYIAQVREQLLALVAFLDKFAPDLMLPVTMRDDGSGGEASNGREDSAMQLSSPYNRSSGNKIGMGTEDNFQDKLYRGLFQMKKTGEARRAEATSIHGLKELSLRCAEALALLLMLSEHQLHRLVPDMPFEMRDLLAKLRFRDLVASEGGQVVSTSLLDSLFSSYSSETNVVSHIGQILHDQCPSFFGTADIALHRGLALLRQAVVKVNEIDVSSTNGGNPVVMHGSKMGVTGDTDSYSLDRAGAFSLAEEAAEILKKAVDRIYDLQAVLADFAAIGCTAILIELALTVGSSAEQAGNQERAEIAYNAVLEALDPLIHESNDGVLLAEEEEYGGAPRETHGPQSENRRLKDACMQSALMSSSNMFLKMLYGFLVRSKGGEVELLQRRSQGIEAFLKERNDQHLMWRYYAKHGRYLDAAIILLELAEGGGEKSLVDRLNYLACALHNAKTAAAAADPRAESLLINIADFMDVAKVQLRVQQELKQRGSDSENVREALLKLDGRIMDLSTLFNNYTRPFELLEACLEALRCGSYRDDAQVRMLWVKLLQREAEAVLHTPALIYQKLVTVGKSFYPSEIAFPVEFVIELLEYYVFERLGTAGWDKEEGWVHRLMMEIGVPFGEIIDAYRNMIESPTQRVGVQGGKWSWSEEKAQMHLVRAAEHALTTWLGNTSGNLRGVMTENISRHSYLSDREKAIRAVSLCKQRLRSMSMAAAGSLLEKFEELDESLNRG